MADVIFLLHGMGEHPEGWEKDIVGQLRSFCDEFSRRGAGDFDQRFKCVGVNYGSLFKDILKEWADRKDGIGDLATHMGAALVDRLLSWIADSDEIEGDFFWTHAFDVATYRLLPTVRDAVKVRVGLQLFEETQELGHNSSWSIIAHSLGTAVAHDTLQSWFTQALPGGGTLGQHKAPRLLQMIANVSRTLQTVPAALESSVRPGGACDFYFTAHHPLDPFTLVRPFLPVGWPGAPSPEKYFPVVLSHQFIQQSNIHDLAHYLRHADVVVPMFRCLAHQTYITKEKENEYREQFKPHGELTDPDLVAVRKRLEKVGVTLPDNWVALLMVWQRIRELGDFAEGVGNG